MITVAFDAINQAIPGHGNLPFSREEKEVWSGRGPGAPTRGFGGLLRTSTGDSTFCGHFPMSTRAVAANEGPVSVGFRSKGTSWHTGGVTSPLTTQNKSQTQ